MNSDGERAPLLSAKRNNNNEIGNTYNNDNYNSIENDNSYEDETDGGSKAKFVHLDGGYGWVVCVATFWCFGVIIGMDYNYSLIYNKLVVVYNTTENHVVYSAWIGSTAFGLECLFCLPASILIDFFGARKIAIIGGFMSGLGILTSAFVTHMPLYFLTYSITFGTGQALLMGSTFSILPHYFNRRIGLATGVMNAGAAVITVTLPIITAKCLADLGLVETFYVLSALSFSTILFAFTYKPMLPSQYTSIVSPMERIKASFGLALFKKPKFVLWCLSCVIGLFGAMNIVLTIDHHSIVTFPNSPPQLLNIVYGASSGVGGVLFGKLGDVTKFSRIYYHALGFIIFGVTQVLIPSARNFSVLCVIIGIFGLADGIYFGFLVTIAYEVAESSQLANQAAGYFQTFVAPSVILGPLVSGLLFEKYGNYTMAYHLGGTICLVCAAIQIFALVYSHCRQRRN